MCKQLRKVVFTLGKYEFIPDATPEETETMNDLSRERKGYFHRWVDDVDTSKDMPYIKTMALVEDVEEGKIYMVDHTNVTFEKN